MKVLKITETAQAGGLLSYDVSPTPQAILRNYLEGGNGLLHIGSLSEKDFQNFKSELESSGNYEVTSFNKNIAYVIEI